MASKNYNKPSCAEDFESHGTGFTDLSAMAQNGFPSYGASMAAGSTVTPHELYGDTGPLLESPSEQSHQLGVGDPTFDTPDIDTPVLAAKDQTRLGKLGKAPDNG